MERKHVFAVLYGLAFFSAIGSIVPQFIALLDWGSRRVGYTGTPFYFVFHQIFTVVSILALIAILVLTMTVLFCPKCNEKRKKIFSIASAGCVLLFLIFWIVMRIMLPVQGVETLPSQWVPADRSLFTTFRAHMMSHIVSGAIMVAIACYDVYRPYVDKCVGFVCEKIGKKPASDSANAAEAVTETEFE